MAQPRALLAVALAVAWLALPGAAAANHAGPLAGQWHLNDDTSADQDDVTSDSSGHGLDAVTAEGTMVLASDGKWGNDLSAVNLSVLTAGPSALLRPAGVTLMGWVRRTGTPPTLRYMAGQGDDGGTCNGPSYAIYTGVGQSAGLQFFIRPEGDNYKPSPIAPDSIWDGQFHFVAGTFDGSTVRLYIDGVEVGNGTPAAGQTIDYGFPGDKFFIGGYPVPACGDGDFPGAIDEVRVYDRALSATEIARLQADSNGPNPPVLTPDDGVVPPPAPDPENVTPPSIVPGADGTYSCEPGEWRNVSSPFSYRWLVFREETRELTRTQTYTPDASVFGYSVGCQVTAAGPSGPVTASSSRVLFTSAGLNVLPPAYGDVRIRGIDVFDTVQPNSSARMFGYGPDRGFAGFCGGGTPTSWLNGLAGCRLGTRDAQYVNYEGVTLDRYKRATAVVYVDVAGGAPTDPGLSYDLELSGFRTGGGLSLGPPVVYKIQNPPTRTTPWVLPFERDSAFTGIGSGGDSSEGIPITLPSAWTSPGGSIRLEARVKFPNRLSQGTATYGMRECDADGCLANDTFTLNDIPFQDYPELLIASIQLRRSTGGQAQLRSAPEVLGRIRDIYPGGSRMKVSPFRADLDITPQTDGTTAVAVPMSSNLICNNAAGNYGTAGPTVTTRSCRSDAVSQVITNWITDNPGRIVGTFGIYVARQYDVVFGVHQYPLAVGGNTEPGWTVGSILSDTRLKPAKLSDTPYFTATDVARPLTAAGHELGHILTAPHSGEDCPVPVGQPGNLTGPGNGANTGEPWTTDNIGRLQSTKFVRRARLRGPTTYTATVDGPFPLGGGATQGTPLLDIMSYCADLADSATADGNTWVSARNWNRYSRELGDLGRRLSQGGFSSAGARHAGGPGPSFAVGVAGESTGSIDRIVPGDGDDGVPEPDPTSPYTLRSLDANGEVLLDAGVTPRMSTSHDGHQSGAFAGPVAPAAAAVELRLGSLLLDSLTRSRPPTVRLASPRRGTRVRGRGKLNVSWSASDPDGDVLAATVDFSADNGKHWRTVYQGPSGGRAVIAGRYLAATKRARVRVNVNDGFSETSAKSQPFVSEGIPPRVEILTPLPGDPVSTGEKTTLIGTASDDIGRTLPGKALTWFAGGKRLGRGAQLRVRLPLGMVSLRLVARDRTGRTGSAKVRLRVQAPQLRIVSLKMPLKVRKNARSMSVRIRSSAPAKLVAGGRSFELGKRARKVTITLPKRPAVGVLSVPFKLSPRSGTARGTIRGRFTTVRT